VNGFVFGILISVMMLVLSCGGPHAGGSVGTDNPQVAVVQTPSAWVSVDTVHFSIWASDFNAIQDSVQAPLWDTTVVGSFSILIDTAALNLPASWNLQAITNNGFISVASNQQIDTLFLPLQSDIRLSSENYSIPDLDTLPWEQVTLDSTPRVPVSSALVWSSDVTSTEPVSMLIPDSAYYIQILGTSILITIQGEQVILPLGRGTYTLIYLDRQGVEISRHQIVVP